jgi:ferrous iron transport protein A
MIVILMWGYNRLIMNLEEVLPGIRARVSRIANTGNQQEDIRGQLEDIGFLPGEQVEVLRKGLLGQGPILIRVGSSTFALRESEARMVEVEIL